MNRWQSVTENLGSRNRDFIDSVSLKFIAAWWATKWLCGSMGAIIMVTWFITRSQLLIIVPAAILVSAMWYAFYKLRVAFDVRWDKGMQPGKNRAGRLVPRVLGISQAGPVHSWEAFRKPPKSARYTWTLLEDGIPVGVESNKRAVDNWIGLGPGHDVEAHELAVQR